MHIKRARIVHIEIDRFRFEKTGETPGLVTVHPGRGESFNLPGNPEDAQRFVDAYLRIVQEDVGYREVEWAPKAELAVAQISNYDAATKLVHKEARKMIVAKKAEAAE